MFQLATVARYDSFTQIIAKQKHYFWDLSVIPFLYFQPATNHMLRTANP
jgi:hypothetical protein